MSEMVELVAMALYRRVADGPIHYRGSAQTFEEAKETYLADARTAIEAMREPTQEMKIAFYAHPQTRGDEDPAEQWQAMIDEALK